MMTRMHREDVEYAGHPNGRVGVDGQFHGLDQVSLSVETGGQGVDDEAGDEDAEQRGEITEHRDHQARHEHPVDEEQMLQHHRDQRDRRENAGVADEQPGDGGRFGLDDVPLRAWSQENVLNASDQPGPVGAVG